MQAELRRCYIQMEINRTKNLRRDNAHIPRKKRKSTRRRSSFIPAFKSRHHLKSAHSSVAEPSVDLDTELSRTPEESTNSVDYASPGHSHMTSEGSQTPRTSKVHFKQKK